MEHKERPTPLQTSPGPASLAPATSPGMDSSQLLLPRAGPGVRRGLEQDVCVCRGAKRV